MWIGWIAVAAGFIAGAIYFVLGYSESARKFLVGAIVGAIIMAFYSSIINALVG
jgi:uncharacterized membrane protein (DUF106 family)